MFELIGRSLYWIDGVYTKEFIKILIDDLEAMKYLINVLNYYYLEPEDFDGIFDLYDADEFDTDEVQIQDIIKILIICNNYTINNLVETENIKELVERIQNTDLNYYVDLNEYKHVIDEIYNIPDNLYEYIDYSAILVDAETRGDINFYKIIKEKNINNQTIADTIAVILVESVQIKNFLYHFNNHIYNKSEFCSNCGAKISSDYKFCRNCGKKIESTKNKN